MTKGPPVVVVGAGFAGIAAAHDLARRGLPVTLLEARGEPGGRTCSFADPTTGETLDSGQHVILGCCSAFRRLLRELGLSGLVHLTRRLDLPVFDDAGRLGRLSATPGLPSPFYTLPSFWRFPLLAAPDKRAIVRGLARLALGGARRDDQAFGAWLTESARQTPSAMARFWNLLSVATCNAPADLISARLGRFVFTSAFLRGRRAGNLGYARIALGALCGRAVVALQRRGVRYCARTRVTGIATDGARSAVQVVTPDGRASLPARAVVLALPPSAAVALLERSAPADPRAANIRALPLAPILGVHLFFDRPVWPTGTRHGRAAGPGAQPSGRALPPYAGLLPEHPLSAGVSGPESAWVFSRTRLFGADPAAGEYLTISVSAAESYRGQSRALTAARWHEQLRRVLPGVARARLVHQRVVFWDRATIVPIPGQASLRPAALPERAERGSRGTSASGATALVLAGAYTRTGWPSTIEGAVRSGFTAAACVARY